LRSLLLRAFGRPRGLLGRLGGRIMARSNLACAVWATELLDTRPSDRILELGFGPGVAIELLAGRALNGYVAGLDASAEMVAQAKRRNAAAIAAGRVDLRQGSVEAIPFPAGAFAKALAINSMQVWPDALAGLGEIRRVLESGGLLALAFTPHSGQTSEGLTELVARAGFAAPHLVTKEENFCVLATKP
jgi:ubiquinone/menaquinone biosynthesis C-methylase UbiE